MFIQKFFGWALVIVAILAIVWAVYDSYKIFTTQKQSPQIFVFQGRAASAAPANSIDAQIQKMIGDQMTNILPANSISTLLNLIAWSIFMGILFWASGQIAGIGIKLLSCEKKPENNRR
jgi:hypothetical protein